MAKAYTKEDVVGAALMRFKGQTQEIQDKLKILYENFYDEKGKDVFRTYASVTPAIMKEYFNK